MDTFKRLKTNLTEEKDEVLEKTLTILRDLKLKAVRTIETKTDSLVQRKTTLREKIEEKFQKLVHRKSKKIKLIFGGDSLVCGVGCEEEVEKLKGGEEVETIKGRVVQRTSSSSSQSLTLSGPVLPQIVAKVLSVAMRADVEWSCAGIVGGTVADVREVLLPEIKRQLGPLRSSHNGLTTKSVANARKIEGSTVASNLTTATNSTGSIKDSTKGSADTEVFVVIICGLNDFKTITEHFPFNDGPGAFKKELSKLVNDIKDVAKELCMDCKVFLPSIPIVCGRGDPSCNIMITPLSNFLEYVAYVWDLQKQAVAIDQHHAYFIGAPSFDKHYATPGCGNFSSDGIHPSAKGYKWWAYHIAESILESNMGLLVLPPAVDDVSLSSNVNA